MKALTVCQPWAHLIIHGVGPKCLYGPIGRKVVENRYQNFTHRGSLAIHAGLSRDWMDPLVMQQYDVAESDLMFGRIVGMVELYACRHNSEVALPEAGVHWIRRDAGTFCLLLRNAEAAICPVTHRGQQGMFDIPDEVMSTAMGRMVGTARSTSLFGPPGRKL